MTLTTIHAEVGARLRWSTDVSVVPWPDDIVAEFATGDRWPLRDLEARLATLGLDDENSARVSGILSSAAAKMNARPAQGVDARDNDAAVAWEEVQLKTRAGALARLQDWFNSREFEPLDTPQQETILVPVFILTAPAVEDCTTKLTLSKEATAMAGFTLKLAGSGFTATSVANVTVTDALEVTNGAAVRVCKRIAVTIEHLKVLEHGQPVGVTHRLRFAAGDPPQPELVTEVDLVPGDMLGTFALGRLPGTLTQMHTIELGRAKSAGLSFGFDAFGQTQKVDASVEVAGKLALEMSLKGGYDYQANNSVSCPGVLWQVK